MSFCLFLFFVSLFQLLSLFSFIHRSFLFTFVEPHLTVFFAFSFFLSFLSVCCWTAEQHNVIMLETFNYAVDDAV